jgi:hypothetical protein
MKPYEKVIEFIASRNPQEVVAFRPSEEARQKVWELLERRKSAPLPPDEETELEDYLKLEHLMRLAKARARQLLGA